MSNDLNYCSFIGRLGRDPETRYNPSGDAVTNFSIAVGEKWTDKASGDVKENVEWVRCVAWRKLAEICGEYLKTGSQVFVSGRLKTRSWDDKEGIKRYSTEIIVSQMQMLSKPSASNDPEKQHEKPAKKPAGAVSDMQDDVPF